MRRAGASVTAGALVALGFAALSAAPGAQADSASDGLRGGAGVDCATTLICDFGRAARAAMAASPVTAGAAGPVARPVSPATAEPAHPATPPSATARPAGTAATPARPAPAA